MTNSEGEVRCFTQLEVSCGFMWRFKKTRVGSCLMKLPQIYNILKAGSVVGLSEAWLVNECIASLLFVYYNVLSGYPFMSFGENVIVGLQNMVIILLFWQYSPQLPRLPRVAGSAIFLLASAAVLVLGLPTAALGALGGAPIFLGNGAKVPQILKNMSQKHTGTMSVVPAFLGFAGCSVRVLTSILQMPDDLLAIMNPLTAALMWFVLLVQFLMFYEATKKVQEEAEAKKKAAAKKAE
eukprot:s1821_g11.t1